MLSMVLYRVPSLTVWSVLLCDSRPTFHELFPIIWTVLNKDLYNRQLIDNYHSGFGPILQLRNI